MIEQLSELENINSTLEQALALLDWIFNKNFWDAEPDIKAFQWSYDSSSKLFSLAQSVIHNQNKALQKATEDLYDINRASKKAAEPEKLIPPPTTLHNTTKTP